MLRMFFDTLITMSLQSIAIMVVVLSVRFLLKKLRISHKYMVGLWFIVFFYLVFPWKVSLPVGFWGNEVVPVGQTVMNRQVNEMEMFEDYNYAVDKYVEDSENAAIASDPSMEQAKETMGEVAQVDVMTDAGIHADMYENGNVGENQNKEVGENGDRTTESIYENVQSVLIRISNVLPYLWLFISLGMGLHLLYFYIAIKKKLLLSVPYDKNIWWAENIDTPMVFGVFHSKIYLPLSVEQGDLTYIIAHERMHIRRKDSQMKLLAYLICLLHWFNPLVWVAYALLGCDMEKACDEEVIQSMGEVEKKEYAYALLHIGSGDPVKKKTVFVAPICFGEGNVKERIRNILKYRYTMPGIGVIVVVAGLGLAVLFLTQTKNEEYVETEQVVSSEAEESVAEEAESAESAKEVSLEAKKDLPAFYVADADVLEISDSFAIEDYYITSRYTASNHYYIDENGVLWGTGSNEYGQLGKKASALEEYYEEPVKIADQVVSVDASWNGYFCIYLTKSGDLYGVGSNYAGLLLGKGSEEMVFSNSEYEKVSRVWLMKDVAYARAGRESIVALKKDKTAYWWGQYAPTTHTSADADFTDYWSVEADDSNPVKMLENEPMKIMDNCKYITTGTFTGAAISEDGELYTWGFNIFGQCGSPVRGDDFLRTPKKILDNVKMVWVDKMYFSDPHSEPSDFRRRDFDYLYNTFVLTNDDSLLAVGKGLGNQEKLTEITGDLVSTEVHLYSDTFVPIQAIEYSEEVVRKVLEQLTFGMSRAEVEGILAKSGLSSFSVEEEGLSYLCVEDSRYYCYFDELGGLERILIQEGGSRDGRFEIGMSMEEVEKSVEAAGGALEQTTEYTEKQAYIFRDLEKQIIYEFCFYENKLSALWESIYTVKRYSVGDIDANGEEEYFLIDNEYSKPEYDGHLSFYLNGESIYEYDSILRTSPGNAECVDLDLDGEKEIFLTFYPYVNSMPLIEYIVLKRTSSGWKTLEMIHGETMLDNGFPIAVKYGKQKNTIEISCEGIEKKIVYDITDHYEAMIDEYQESGLQVGTLEYILEGDYYTAGDEFGEVAAWGIWDIVSSIYEGDHCLIATHGIQGPEGKFDMLGKLDVYFRYNEDGRVKIVNIEFRVTEE